LCQALETYIKPASMPIGVKLIRIDEEFELPEKTKIPTRDFKKRLTICQANNLARKYGWTVALGREDQACPIGSLVLGFQRRVDYYTQGNLACGMYTETMEAGANAEKEIKCFFLGKYRYYLAGPLARIAFSFDFALVYVNPAQLMRVVEPRFSPKYIELEKIWAEEQNGCE